MVDEALEPVEVVVAVEDRRKSGFSRALSSAIIYAIVAERELCSDEGRARSRKNGVNVIEAS